MPFALRGLGGGDVKLLAALGAWVGPTDVIWVALYTGVAGGLLALATALANGYLRTALTNVGRLLAHWRMVGVTALPELTLERQHRPQAGIRTAHPVRNDGDDMAALTRLRRLSSERGSQIVEGALVLPLLLLVVLGILDFGMLFWRFESVTNAAREGARVAVLQGYEEADVELRVEQFLTDAGLDPDAADITFEAPVGVDVGDGAGPCITMTGVTVSYPHDYFLVGGIMGYFGGTSLTSTALVARSRMRYEGGAVAVRGPLSRELQLLLGCMRSIA